MINSVHTLTVLETIGRLHVGGTGFNLKRGPW